MTRRNDYNLKEDRGNSNNSNNNKNNNSKLGEIIKSI